MNKSIYTIHIILLMLIQVFIMNNIHMSSYICIHIYILAIIMAPDEMDKTLLLTLAFILGLSVDITNNTMGISAAASTLLAYIRPAVLRAVGMHHQTPIKNSIRSGNTSWLIKYSSILTSIYFIVLIFLEAFTFENFFTSILRIISSTIVSLFIMMLYNYTAIRTERHE